MQTHAASKDLASHASKPFFGLQPARSTAFFASLPAIQTKLTVGAAGDRFEREADAVADAVVQRMDAVRISRTAASPVPASVEQSLQAGHAGQALAPELQAQMEQAFQADFSQVRIHTGGPAEQLSQELQARAFTTGNDVYFNAGEFNPGTRDGQHLLAHELTHVVQQSRPAGSGPSVQRDVPKPGSAAAKIEAAKTALKTKFGFREVSEQNGVAWTEGQLKQIAVSFSRMSVEEQKRLQGVTFMLTDKFPPKTLKGTTFSIAGTTYGTGLVELTANGVRNSVLHEAGHLIHNNAIANAEKLFARSQFKADLEIARDVLKQSSRQRFVLGEGQNYVMDQINEVIVAANVFERSGVDDRKTNRDALELAELNLPAVGSDAASKPLAEHIVKVRAFAAAMLRWSDEKEKAVGPVRRLDEFVAIVKKHRLDRRSAAFTSYAESNWPAKPEEFFSEAYELYRKSPADLKKISKDLFGWFEKGGHLGPPIPPPRQP